MLIIIIIIIIMIIIFLFQNEFMSPAPYFKDKKFCLISNS